jgi:hypothetical protein
MERRFSMAFSSFDNSLRYLLGLPKLRERAWDAVEAGGDGSGKRRGMPVSDAEKFAARYPAFAGCMAGRVI